MSQKMVLHLSYYIPPISKTSDDFMVDDFNPWPKNCLTSGQITELHVFFSTMETFSERICLLTTVYAEQISQNQDIYVTNAFFGSCLH